MQGLITELERGLGSILRRKDPGSYKVAMSSFLHYCCYVKPTDVKEGQLLKTKKMHLVERKDSRKNNSGDCPYLVMFKFNKTKATNIKGTKIWTQTWAQSTE
jgi:hypothetical protein